MSFQPAEQLIHDRVNLVRLVRKLEETVGSPEWKQTTGERSRAAWVQTQGMLTKLKYARKLLKKVELYHAVDDSSSAASRYEEIGRKIQRLEENVTEIHKQVAYQPRKPASILSTLPLPAPTARVLNKPANGDVLPTPTPIREDLPSTDETATVFDTPRLSPLNGIPPLPISSTMSGSTASDPAASLIPATPSTRTESSTTLPPGAPAFLQNSAALHEEMSSQLAQMAAQLKRNALHFSESLEKDKALVLDAQEKIERNAEVMTKERLRLRDHRGKSWGTTWIVLLSMLVAVIGFVLTFLVIRIT